MTKIARVCQAAGHQVRYWFGPLGGWLPNQWWKGDPQLAFVWNGNKPRYLPSIRRLDSEGAQVIYVEHGWYPQGPTVQMDPVGINCGASWASRPLPVRRGTSLPVREQGDLLLLLQHDADVQITRYSPWFANMEEFTAHVIAHSRLPVQVRPHPRHPPTAKLREFVLAHGHRWDESPSLGAALARCRAVACVNSSSAIEALSQNLPVLCFGEAIYRHPGVVYCLDSQPESLHKATSELAAGETTICAEQVQMLLERVQANQFAIAELPQTLPRLIDGWLALRRPALQAEKWRTVRVASGPASVVPLGPIWTTSQPLS